MRGPLHPGGRELASGLNRGDKKPTQYPTQIVSGPGAIAQEVRLRSGWELVVVHLPGLWVETRMVWYRLHIEFFSRGLKLRDQDLE